jgi:uncharacterized protein YigE (DUF2233 family)
MRANVRAKRAGERRRRLLRGIGGIITRTRRNPDPRALCATLAAALLWLWAVTGASAADSCSPTRFEGSGFVVCVFDPARDDLRLFWRGPNRKPYGGFSAIEETLKSQKRELVFAMNGGMFEKNFSPVGLYIEDGRQLQRPDTRAGGSNFHLRPNGIFWIGKGVAGVTETARYLADPPEALYATQSGPMLVLEGHIHPKIMPTGTSEKLRNGVGVRSDGTVVFAISDSPVTFDTFARLFRDALACPNALFLDGSVSSLYAPELARDDELAPLGPIIGIVAPAK